MTGRDLQPVSTLPALDDFARYARAVRAIPDLPPSKERELALAWHQNRDPDAARDLVLAHLKLVVRAVRAHAGYKLSPADLAQEGTIGLMKAVHRFDPDRGVRLASYAWHWIEAQIRAFILGNWRMVGWGSSANAKKLFFGYRSNLQALQEAGDGSHQPPSPEQIAQAMGVDHADAVRAHAYLLGRDVALLEENPDDASAVALPAPDDPANAALCAERITQAAAAALALESLEPRARHILQARYLQEPPATLAALAAQYAISIERVRQIEQSALSALRKRLPAP